MGGKERIYALLLLYTLSSAHAGDLYTAESYAILLELFGSSVFWQAVHPLHSMKL
jgi:hypothetical protein